MADFHNRKSPIDSVDTFPNSSHSFSTTLTFIQVPSAKRVPKESVGAWGMLIWEWDLWFSLS